ncbi:MAG: hypothetical protein HZC22_08930 [Rhodocyclales bacterium]|nr:hypothetical protein [Rhodocyclales bacterium]
MTDVNFKPVRHDHKAFIERATKRKGFVEAYDVLEIKYRLTKLTLKAHSLNSLTQDQN